MRNYIQLLRCYFYGNVYSVTIAMAVIIISAVICRQSCMHVHVNYVTGDTTRMQEIMHSVACSPIH